MYVYIYVYIYILLCIYQIIMKSTRCTCRIKWNDGNEQQEQTNWTIMTNLQNTRNYYETLTIHELWWNSSTHLWWFMMDIVWYSNSIENTGNYKKSEVRTQSYTLGLRISLGAKNPWLQAFTGEKPSDFEAAKTGKKNTHGHATLYYNSMIHYDILCNYRNI